MLGSVNLKLSVERVVVEAAGQVEVADPGGKPDDRGGERASRHRAVAELRSALTVEAAVRAAAADAVEGRAEAAVWLGASLADLAAVTGRTRQAARKRWPGLGDVSRRRRFLGYHVDDVLWAARLVLDAADDLEGVDETARGALATAVAEAERAFRGEPAEAAVDVATAVARWQAFDRLVDRHLRDLLAGVPDEPTDPAAGFAAHGARGVLRYYDHAVHEAVETGD